MQALPDAKSMVFKFVYRSVAFPSEDIHRAHTFALMMVEFSGSLDQRYPQTLCRFVHVSRLATPSISIALMRFSTLISEVPGVSASEGHRRWQTGEV